MPGGRQKRLDLPAPQEGSRRFFYLLWTYIWKLVWLNVAFLIFCIPVITIPAAISAMDRALIVLVRSGNVLLWEEFRDEFKRDFGACLPLGLLFGGVRRSCGSHFLSRTPRFAGCPRRWRGEAL